MNNKKNIYFVILTYTISILIALLMSLTNNNSTIRVSVQTSPMEIFVGYGEHTHTTWEITNSDGVTIFSRKKSKDMLTSITIPKEDFQHDEV
mgnify:CR=1 FL=1